MKIGVADLDHAKDIIVAVVRIILKFILSSADRDVAEVCDDVSAVVEALPSASSMIAEGRKK